MCDLWILYIHVYVLQWSAPATDSGRDPGWRVESEETLECE